MEDDIDNDNKKGKKPKKRASKSVKAPSVTPHDAPPMEPDPDADPDLDALLSAGGPDAPEEGGFLSASELVDDDQGSPEIRERVGQRLRQLRKRARLTQTGSAPAPAASAPGRSAALRTASACPASRPSPSSPVV